MHFHLYAMILIRKLQCSSGWEWGRHWIQNRCQQMQKCHGNLWPRNNSLPKYTHTVVGLLSRYTAVCIDNSAVGQESRRQANLPSRCHCQWGAIWHLVLWLPTFFPILWHEFSQGLLKEMKTLKTSVLICRNNAVPQESFMLFECLIP